MRIRKSASRLLGSTFPLTAAPAPDAGHPFEPPPPPPPMPFMVPPCAEPESLAGSSISSPATTASGETCELSRSPWDLIAELSLSDPQVEDDLLDKYFVPVTCRATWLFTASMPVASVKKKEKQAEAVGAGTTSQPGPRQDVPKKVPKKLAVRKECEPKKKVKVQKEEVQEVKQATYKCKKNDGKRWHCSRPVSSPNSLCDYHFYQKRAYLSPDFAALAVAEAKSKELEVLVPQPAAVSKPVSRPKPRKKKPGHDLAATEGFYYYAGFGPFRNKRQCRSSGTNHSVPLMKQDEEDEQSEDISPSNQQAPAAADGPNNTAAAHEDASSCDDDIARIAGGDEESSDDDYRLGVSGRNMNGHGEHRDGKRKNGLKKRWRKPVKARSLKSLM